VVDTNIIELNGKRYDALTGKAIAHPKAVVNQAKQLTRESAVSAHVIDDFIRQPRRPLPKAALRPASAPTRPAVVSQPSLTPPRHRSLSINARRPQPTKTLMRTSVKKPKPSLKKLVRVRTAAGSAPKVMTLSAAKTTAQDTKRWGRAHQTPKSSAVHHFTQVTSAPVLVRHYAALPVKLSPPVLRTARQTSQVAHLTEAGLSRANAHQQLAPAKKNWHARLARKLHTKPRRLTIAIVSLVVLLTAGLLAYENRAAIDVRIAATRTNIAATLPGYTPSGFSFREPVIYGGGQVTISYHSTSDQRHYSILEHASNWDSQTLYNNLVSIGHQTYQTLQSAGRTVYVDGQGNASWVNSGLLYQISGNASLSNQQLLGIVTSL